MKNFNIWAFTEKSDFQRMDFTKTYKEDGLPKKGARTVCRFKEGKEGFVKKERVFFFFFVGEVDTPMHTMLLDQTEGERRTFLEGSKKGNRIVRLPPKSTCHKKRKILSFCEI